MSNSFLVIPEELENEEIYSYDEKDLRFLEEYEKQQKIELSPFYKKTPNSKIWWTSAIDIFGLYLFSFDRKKIYNFFSDWDELTEEQKELFRKEEPSLAKLKR